MQRILVITAAIVCVLAARQTQAEVKGATFQVNVISASNLPTTGSMDFKNTGAFTYTPSAGDAQKGYYLETADSSGGSNVTMLYNDGTDASGVGYASSAPLTFGSFSLTLLFGVNLSSDPSVFFGYAFSLSGFPTLSL